MALRSVSKADPNYVPNYQLSAIPYVTSSAANEITNTPIQFTFPYVTKYIFVHNTGTNDIRIGFTENGVDATETANYFVIDGHSNNKDHGVHPIDVRCKELWVRTDGNGTTSTVSIFAGLTPIGSGSFPTLTGSAGFEGVG